MDLVLPHDFEQWPEVRQVARPQLAEAMGVTLGEADPHVVLAFVRLWGQLGLQCGVTGQVGRLSKRAVAAWMAESGITLHGEDSVLDCFRDAESPDQGLLQPADGGDWFCPRFARLHPHLDPRRIDGPRLGTLRSGHVRRLKRLQRETVQLGLLVDRDKFKLPDGSTASPDQCESAILLIHACDSALGLPDRQVNDASLGEAVVRDALKLLSTRQSAEVDAVIGAVLELTELGGHPMLPQTTDDLLRRFDDVAGSPVVKEVIGRR